MWMIIFFTITVVASIVAIALIIWDNIAYHKMIEKKKKKEQKAKEAKKKNLKEFTWGEHLPRHDL